MRNYDRCPACGISICLGECGLPVVDDTPANAECEQCGRDVDLMVLFTERPICGKCTRKNHAKATGN